MIFHPLVNFVKGEFLKVAISHTVNYLWIWRFLIDNFEWHLVTPEWIKSTWNHWKSVTMGLFMRLPNHKSIETPTNCCCHRPQLRFSKKRKNCSEKNHQPRTDKRSTLVLQVHTWCIRVCIYILWTCKICICIVSLCNVCMNIYIYHVHMYNIYICTTHYSLYCFKHFVNLTLCSSVSYRGPSWSIFHFHI